MSAFASSEYGGDQLSAIQNQYPEYDETQTIFGTFDNGADPADRAADEAYGTDRELGLDCSDYDDQSGRAETVDAPPEEDSTDVVQESVTASTSYRPTDRTRSETPYDDVNRELLKMSDLDRRHLTGAAYDEKLAAEGLEGTTVVYNVQDALPPTTVADLTAHAAPPEAYTGRSLGLAMNLGSNLPVRIAGSAPLAPEVEFAGQLADKAGLQMPELTPPTDHVDEDHFVYPFIGCNELNDKYPGRTIADAQPFNHKGNMREMTRQVGGNGSVVPGTELYYEGQDPDEYAELVFSALRRQQADSPTDKVWLKPVGTASGLQTHKYGPEVQQAEFGDQVLNGHLRNMFGVDENGTMTPTDVVIEHHSNFGHQHGPADYNLRGAKTPEGLFVPQTVGRQISTSGGEFVGAVMVSANDSDALDVIGLHPKTLLRASSLMSGLADGMGDGYPFGPMSTDFFSAQRSPDAQPQKRDFNVREGGTTFGGLVCALKDQLWPGARAVMDVEMQIYPTGSRPSEARLEAMVDKLYGSGYVPYATTFLRYPNAEGRYTLKVVAPFDGVITSDDDIVKGMRNMAGSINNQLGMADLKFVSPL